MTRYQIDPRLHSDSDLARHLLTTRGVHWMHGERGAPLALLLRGHGFDRRALHDEVRGHPGLRPSNVDVWVTADHATAATLLSDRRLTVRDARLVRRRGKVFTSDADSTPKHVLAIDDGTLGLEHHDHDRLSRFARPVFGTDAVAGHARRFAEIFDARAAAVTGPFDLMADIALPGAGIALADLVGLPAAARTRFADLVAGTVPVLDALLCPPTLRSTRRLVASYDGIKAMLTDLAGASATGALGELLRAAGTDPVAGADAVTTCLLTLVVGTHVSANLVCGTVLALLDHPDELALVRGDPTLAGAAVAETLRYDPPVRLASRIAGEDVELAGSLLRAGDQVVVLLDAANRDPAAFADPATFRVTRADRAHQLALDDLTTRFVAPVVRTLATEAVRALVTRLPGLESAGPPVRHMRSPVVGSVARCPVNVLSLDVVGSR